MKHLNSGHTFSALFASLEWTTQVSASSYAASAVATPGQGLTPHGLLRSHFTAHRGCNQPKPTNRGATWNRVLTLPLSAFYPSE